jgi:hypothetical protein
VEPAHRSVLQGRRHPLADAAPRLRPGRLLHRRQLLPDHRRRGAPTAVAQVFNERGDGVVVRGGTATISKTDKRPHLAEADEREIDFLELIWIQRRGAPHLFRTGQLPPLRGTSVQLDPSTLLLYTRGSIPYFRTYPGIYVPQPLLLRPAEDGTDLQGAGADVMALSKMNWNNAQLDERDPLTLRTAHRVGAILRHVPPDAQIATRYAYDM